MWNTLNPTQTQNTLLSRTKSQEKWIGKRKPMLVPTNQYSDYNDFSASSKFATDKQIQNSGKPVYSPKQLKSP